MARDKWGKHTKYRMRGQAQWNSSRIVWSQIRLDSKIYKDRIKIMLSMKPMRHSKGMETRKRALVAITKVRLGRRHRDPMLNSALVPVWWVKSLTIETWLTSPMAIRKISNSKTNSENNRVPLCNSRLTVNHHRRIDYRHSLIQVATASRWDLWLLSWANEVATKIMFNYLATSCQEIRIVEIIS